MKKKRTLARWLRRLGVVLLIIAGLCWIVPVVYIDYSTANTDYPPLRTSERSTILAKDGKTVLGYISPPNANRIVLPDSEISPLIRLAHIAAEDRRFYEHSGISIPGIANAAFQDLLNLSWDNGGSSITQQYAKNAYLDPQERTFRRKKQELILAHKLEEDFSKDQILAKYVNSNPYGLGAYGIEAGSLAWFGHSANQLNNTADPTQVAKAAFLAAIIQQPSYFAEVAPGTSQLVHLNELIDRQRYVLDGLRDIRGVSEDQLVQQDVIDKAKALLPIPLANATRASTAASGDTYLINFVKDWMVAQQTQIARNEGMEEADAKISGAAQAEALLGRGGLRIVTTIDAALQQAIKTAVSKHLPKNGVSAGATILDSVSGAVVAMYGGDSNSEFNFALADRQVGSVMKPIVLADAVQKGISPESVFAAPPYFESGGVKIWNHTKQAGGVNCRMSLVDAMAQSNNPVFIELITGRMASCENPAAASEIEYFYPVSPTSVAELARNMGADDSLVPGRKNPANLVEVPTLALGTSNLNTVKVASIGATLANGGVHTTPHIIDVISKTDTTTTFRHAPASNTALDPTDAHTVNQVLARVYINGTASGAKVPGRALAGKTGSTETDAWMLSYSAVDPSGQVPSYACAAWAGFADSRPLGNSPSSATMAKICSSFMQTALSGLPSIPFLSANLDAGRHIGLRR